MISEQQLLHYSPPNSAIVLLNQTKIALIVGISAAGKDTIQSRLLKSADYQSIITHTTRAPRENNGILEQSGREYHFVSETEMSQLLDQKMMIEINKFGQNLYGTSIAEFEKAHQNDKIALADIDVHGIAAFRSIAGEAVKAIFVIPPDYATWRQRLAKRYSTPEELEHELPGRARIAVTELEEALSVPYYHFIINDDLNRAVGAADDIAHRPDTFFREDDEARLVARDLLERIKNFLIIR